MAGCAATEPFVVVGAEGHRLIDDRRRRYFDATSALWCNLLGHRVAQIDAAVRDQLGRFAHTTLLGAMHPGVVELARRLSGACASRPRRGSRASEAHSPTR